MSEKLKRLIKTLPAFYRAEVNTYLNGLLQAWAVSDEEIEIQISNAKDQLFVETAEGRYLDLNANNYGVERTPELGIEDSDFRRLIPVLSTYPKQVRQTLISLFDVFWGPGFTRANLNSGNTEPFNFGAPTPLLGKVVFKKGQKTVRGTGTSFLTQLQPGDWIKPSGFDDHHFARVSQILSDEEVTLTLSWPFNSVGTTGAEKTTPLTLEYSVDSGPPKLIRFSPNAFKDLTKVTTQELADFINSSPTDQNYITAQTFLDPQTGNKLNIRTNTPGLQGAIQIIGGSANSPGILNFSLNKQTEVKTAVYEINPNEVIVQIPSGVPVLRRTLRGSVHPKNMKTTITSQKEPFNFEVLGNTSTLEIIIDGQPTTITFNHLTDFENPSRVSAKEVEIAINRQAIFIEAFSNKMGSYKSVGIRTTEGSSEYQVTGGTANNILQYPTELQIDPDVIVENYPSSYIFDPTGQLYTVTGVNTTLNTEIEEGTQVSTIDVENAANFPNRPGLILFNFGRSEQEGPIQYRNRPNNSTLLIDSSFIFQKRHEVGRYVNLVSDKPTIPRVTGADYPVYVVGTQEARAAAQTLIRKLIASGVVIRFIIEFPEVLFECKITAPDTASHVGSRTSLGPISFY